MKTYSEPRENYQARSTKFADAVTELQHAPAVAGAPIMFSGALTPAQFELQAVCPPHGMRPGAARALELHRANPGMSRAQAAKMLGTNPGRHGEQVKDLAADGFVAIEIRRGKSWRVRVLDNADAVPMRSACRRRACKQPTGDRSADHEHPLVQDKRQLELFYIEQSPADAVAADSSISSNPDSMCEANPDSNCWNPDSSGTMNPPANTESLFSAVPEEKREEKNTAHAHARIREADQDEVVTPRRADPDDVAAPQSVPELMRADWQPARADLVFAGEIGLADPTAACDDFRDWCLANAVRSADWSASVRRWCRNRREREQARVAREGTRAATARKPLMQPWLLAKCGFMSDARAAA